MKSVVTRVLCFSAVLVSGVIQGGAQERPAAAADPRVGLKAGLHDAGEAARNMERISSLPKPKGFFDPKAPGGEPTPPERDSKTAGGDPAAAAARSTAPDASS